VAVRLSTSHVTVALVALWLVAAFVTLPMATAGGAMDPTHWVPLTALTAILAAWPFLLGWRPFTRSGHRLRTCSDCGTVWRPADEGGAGNCPACATAA